MVDRPDREVFPEFYGIEESPSPIVASMIHIKANPGQHLIAVFDMQRDRAIKGVPVLKPSRLAIACAILRHLNMDSQTATPSVETLAKIAGVKHRTAQEALTDLVRDKIIDRRMRHMLTSVYGVGKSLAPYTARVVTRGMTFKGRNHR